MITTISIIKTKCKQEQKKTKIHVHSTRMNNMYSVIHNTVENIWLLHIAVITIAYQWETNRPVSSEWLRESDTQSGELNSLMATVRNGFLWRSVVHLGGISLVLNVLLWLTTMLLGEHPPLWHHCPTTSLALRISLSSLLAFATLSLLPQHTTAQRTSLIVL